jgi:hypothetical protein
MRGCQPKVTSLAVKAEHRGGRTAILLLMRLELHQSPQHHHNLGIASCYFSLLGGVGRTAIDETGRVDHTYCLVCNGTILYSLHRPGSSATTANNTLVTFDWWKTFHTEWVWCITRSHRNDTKELKKEVLTYYYYFISRDCRSVYLTNVL